MIGIVKLIQQIQNTINGHSGFSYSYITKGLAYVDEVAVNWCPALGTVLSNEEVIDGLYLNVAVTSLS